jgi:hypothetical protein
MRSVGDLTTPKIGSDSDANSGGKTPLPPLLRCRQLFIDYIKPQVVRAFFTVAGAASRSSSTSSPKVSSLFLPKTELRLKAYSSNP